MLLFLTMFSLYGLTSSWYFQSDIRFAFETTYRLVEDHALTIPAGSTTNDCRITIGKDHQWYSQYEPGMSIVLIPFFLIGKFIYLVTGIDARMPISTMILIICGAGLITLIYFDLKKRRYSETICLVTALSYGLFSMIWWYTKPYTRDIVITFLFFSSYYLAESYLKTKQLRSLLLVSLLLTGLIWIKSSAALAFFGYLFLMFGSINSFRTSEIKRILYFILPFAMGVGLLILYNYILFGNFLTGGYDNQLEGAGNLLNAVYGMIISPGNGILIHNLILIPALIGLYRYSPKKYLIFAALIFFPFFLYLGTRWFWNSVPFWGPRYIMYIIPFTAIGLADYLKHLGQKLQNRRLFVVILIISAILHIPAVLMSNGTYQYYLLDHYTLPDYTYTPSLSYGYLNGQILIAGINRQDSVTIKAPENYFVHRFLPDGKEIYDFTSRDYKKKFKLEWDAIAINCWSGYSLSYQLLTITLVVLLFGSIIGLIRTLKQSGTITT